MTATFFLLTNCTIKIFQIQYQPSKYIDTNKFKIVCICYDLRFVPDKRHIHACRCFGAKAEKGQKFIKFFFSLPSPWINKCGNEEKRRNWSKCPIEYRARMYIEIFFIIIMECLISRIARHICLSCTSHVNLDNNNNNSSGKNHIDWNDKSKYMRTKSHFIQDTYP